MLKRSVNAKGFKVWQEKEYVRVWLSIVYNILLKSVDSDSSIYVYKYQNHEQANHNKVE